MSWRDILDALAMGAENMVSTGVILLCAGIIIGIVLLVGMGIKFSMIIQMVSGGSLVITILLIMIAAIFLGMGLPVTASYITLAVLAAPAMTMLGAGLLASHLMIFWFSQFANVTPPICLAAYSAAGIAKSKPFETGMQGWKLSSGMYVIPILIVYTPLIFTGTVIMAIETTVATAIGLFSMAILLEGYYRRHVNILKRLVCGCAAALLFWPSIALHLAGLLLFAAFLLVHILYGRKKEEKAT